MQHKDKSHNSEYQFYKSKIENYQDVQPGAFSEYHTNDDEFAETENRLQVIFSDTFKNWYRNRKGRGPGRGYKLLTKDSMYRVEGYEDNHPESFKSVAVAENGLGDCISLQLKRESNFDLGANIFYECLHESGRIQVYKIIT